MERSIQKYVERDTFIRTPGRLRLAVGTDARIVVFDLTANWRNHRSRRSARSAGLRLTGIGATGRQVERALAAARGQAERHDQRADQSQTGKRAVTNVVQETLLR